MTTFWARLLHRREDDRPDPGRQEAQNAVSESEEALQQVREQGKEVRAVSERMRELRERNHFAEAISASMARKGWHRA